jgi:hypothetical protein
MAAGCIIISTRESVFPTRESGFPTQRSEMVRNGPDDPNRCRGTLSGCFAVYRRPDLTNNPEYWERVTEGM